MENWIEIISFTYPHEAHLAKIKLESEGIQTKIKDELTAQVNNFYSNAIGGVKLFVKESDSKRTLEILKESKIIIDSKTEHIISERKSKSRILTAKMLYYFSALVLIIAVGAILYSILNLPTTHEKLIRTNWCFNSMYYNDYEFFPNTVKPEGNSKFKITMVGECTEFITFMENGIVLLPGFDSDRLKANWKLDGKKLTIWPENNDLTLVNKSKENIISGEEPLVQIYYGVYKVDFENVYLILENENGIIYANR